MKEKIPHLSFLLLLMVSGCRVGPVYEPPFTAAPEEWKNPHQECANLPEVCFWWEVFNDDTLNSLEEQAVENNPTLYVAYERIVEAWAVAGISKADLYPQLNLNPSYSSLGTLFQIFLPSTINIPGISSISPYFRVHELQYLFPLNLSYEIDLWGKIRGIYESNVYAAQAQEEAYRTAILSLTTDLASSYFNLRALDSTIQLLKETIEVRKEEYNFNEMRYNKGLVPKLDLLNATVDLYNTEASYYDALRQRGLLEDMIAAFIGIPASEFHLEPNPLRDDPPVIPAGIPSSLLAQRPDIAEAERIMASEHALINVGYASFLPSLSLTGALGYSSPDLHDFFKWRSRYWAIGGSAGQTVFDGWRKNFSLDDYWARYEEALGEYQQTVITAFKEVEDALNNIELQDKQYQSLKRSADAAQNTTKLSKLRYKNGLVNYLEVVVNQRTELDVEVNYSTLLGQRYQSTVQLIKALGGSWE